MSGSDEHYITGALSVTADAYGSMITPDGNTLTDVLRLHVIESTRDSNLTFGITNTVKHYYQWYSQGQKGFILRFEMNPDSITISSAQYQKQSNVITAVSNIRSEKSAITFYPNPGDGHFRVSSSDNSLCILNVSNSLGENIILNQFIKNGEEINLSSQPAGIYFAQIFYKEEVVIIKFLVE